MRQLSVFSTSLGPRPGALVPTTSTGGVSSGNVSTLMRGVTTTANTTSAMAAINTAMGLRNARPVTGGPPRPEKDGIDGAPPAGSSLLRRGGGLTGQQAGRLGRVGRAERRSRDRHQLRFARLTVLERGRALA